MKVQNQSQGGRPQMPMILVIDDDASLRETLRMILQTSFRVKTVSSVDTALEEIRLEVPDGIVMDLTMPVKDGLQGLREIRPGNPELPILMLTGYADNETKQNALDLGATEVMRKPFDLVKLITLLTEMTSPSVKPVAATLKGSLAQI